MPNVITNVTMLEKSGLLILPSTLKRCHSANYDWFRIFEMGNDKWQL